MSSITLTVSSVRDDNERRMYIIFDRTRQHRNSANRCHIPAAPGFEYVPHLFKLFGYVYGCKINSIDIKDVTFFYLEQ